MACTYGSYCMAQRCGTNTYLRQYWSICNGKTSYGNITCSC